MKKKKTIGIAVFVVLIVLFSGCSGDIQIENETGPSSSMSVIDDMAQEPVFSDVQDAASWYYQPVYWAVKHHVTKGTAETAFSPDQTCTRAEIVTFLWRYFGEQNVKASVSFDDVSPTEFFFEAVKWAVDNQITNGITVDTFSPDDSCTRAQMVTFLWRSLQSPEAGSADCSFIDISENEYYYQAVKWAVDKHITYGVSDTEFSPDSFCTRAEVVTFLYRASSIIKDVKVKVSD